MKDDLIVKAMHFQSKICGGKSGVDNIDASPFLVIPHKILCRVSFTRRDHIDPCFIH
jgi:hypothetical protein